MLFEVAIVETPTKKELEDGAVERLVFGPKCVVAKDIQAAGIKAVTDGDKPPTINMDRAQVFVRPFVE